jgi:ribosomal protein L22
MTTARYGIKDNQVRAFNKMIRVSHQKLNLVCDTVRGLPVERAIDVLIFKETRCR